MLLIQCVYNAASTSAQARREAIALLLPTMQVYLQTLAYPTNQTEAISQHLVDTFRDGLLAYIASPLRKGEPPAVQKNS